MFTSTIHFRRTLATFMFFSVFFFCFSLILLHFYPIFAQWKADFVSSMINKIAFNKTNLLQTTHTHAHKHNSCVAIISPAAICDILSYGRSFVMYNKCHHLYNYLFTISTMNVNSMTKTKQKQNKKKWKTMNEGMQCNLWSGIMHFSLISIYFDYYETLVYASRICIIQGHATIIYWFRKYFEMSVLHIACFFFLYYSS